MSDHLRALDQMLAQTKAMQQQMIDMRARLADREYVGTSTDGKVSIRMTAMGDFTSVTIDKSLDAGAAEKLVLEALRDVAAQQQAAQQQRASELVSAFDVLRPE